MRKQLSIFEQVNGLTMLSDAQKAELAEYEREMTKVAIPEMIEAEKRRVILAEITRRRVVF